MARQKKLHSPTVAPATSLDIKLIPKQMEAYQYLTDMNNGVSEVLFGGGSRGGKSWLGCLWQDDGSCACEGSAEKGRSTRKKNAIRQWDGRMAVMEKVLISRGNYVTLRESWHENWILFTVYF